MASFDFPSTAGQPTDGTFTYAPVGTELEYAWNGTTWVLTGSGGGGSKTEVGDTPPAPPKDGQLWWNTNDGFLYVYYVQSNGQGQWVQSTPTDSFDGGVINNSITTPLRGVGDPWALSRGPYWIIDGVDVSNPTGVVAGMSGLFYIINSPLSWGSYFKFPEGVQINPGPSSIVPFFVISPTEIALGFPTGGIA